MKTFAELLKEINENPGGDEIVNNIERLRGVSDRVEIYLIEEGWIYFTRYSLGYYDYFSRIRTDGTGEELIYEGNLGFVELCDVRKEDEWIYYSAEWNVGSGKRGTNHYRFRTDGAKNEQVGSYRD